MGKEVENGGLERGLSSLSHRGLHECSRCGEGKREREEGRAGKLFRLIPALCLFFSLSLSQTLKCCSFSGPLTWENIHVSERAKKKELNDWNPLNEAALTPNYNSVCTFWFDTERQNWFLHHTLLHTFHTDARQMNILLFYPSNKELIWEVVLFEGDFLLTMNSLVCFISPGIFCSLAVYWTIVFNNSKVQGHSDIYVAEAQCFVWGFFLCIIALYLPNSPSEWAFFQMVEIKMNNWLLLYMLLQGSAYMLRLVGGHIWCHRAIFSCSSDSYQFESS